MEWDEHGMRITIATISFCTATQRERDWTTALIACTCPFFSSYTNFEESIALALRCIALLATIQVSVSLFRSCISLRFIKFCVCFDYLIVSVGAGANRC